MIDEEQRTCQETISIRDTYRYSGRRRGGFSMHYTERRCHRPVRDGDDYCWQHREPAIADPQPAPTTGGSEG